MSGIPRSLPARPDLNQLRRQAKELHRAASAHVPSAVGRLARHAGGSRALLSAAQLTIAREHGFRSWPALKAEVEHRTMTVTQRVDALLAASISDGVGRAARLLAENPQLPAADAAAAAVVGDLAALRRFVVREPALAVEPDARRAWPLLHYACASCWHRLDPTRREALGQIANLLIDAGADPGPALQHAVGANNPSLTALLLRRGADPDDGESLYHATEHPDGEVLRLLIGGGAREEGTLALAHMIDRDDPDGVALLLGTGADPNQSGGGLLAHAIVRDCGVPVVTLLLDAGAEVTGTEGRGLSPVRLATRRGADDVAAVLLARGAPDDATEVDRFLGACSRGDRAGATAMLDRHPGLLADLGRDDHAALCDAAHYGRRDGVVLMLDLGFPVGTHGEYGGTALHLAALRGRTALVRTLLGRGADPDGRDTEYDSTSLVWALVGHGDYRYAHPDGDWSGTVEALLDAGASVEGARLPIDDDDLADLLQRHGVADAE